MITKTYIRQLDFQNIQEVFAYVVESVINGQRQQAREIIGTMSQRQRNQFAMYLENECELHHTAIDETKNILFND